MNNEKDFWSEVRCTYNNEEGFWCVDAYKTDDPDEQGEVIAAIHETSGDVYYVNQLARHSALAQEVIKAKVAECKPTEPLCKYTCFDRVIHLLKAVESEDVLKDIVYLIVNDGLSALLDYCVEKQVMTQGQADVALLSDGHLPLEQGMIDLMDAAMQEEVLQLMVLLFGESDEHEAAGVHVETMDDERSGGPREHLSHGILHVGLLLLAWHGEHPGRLAHHGQLLIIIYNV